MAGCFMSGLAVAGALRVLDASEIPPTFSASPDLVQGIIAGGTTALYRSVEGAGRRGKRWHIGSAGKGNKKWRCCHWDHRQWPDTFCPRRAVSREVVRCKDDSADVQSGCSRGG